MGEQIVHAFENLPKAYYATEYGAAYLGDALGLSKLLPDKSVNLIMTSPPFALNRRKAYGNVDSSEYVIKENQHVRYTILSYFWNFATIMIATVSFTLPKTFIGSILLGYLLQQNG